MQNIIIFKSHFYPLSETFIRNQVDYVKEFFIVYLVAERFTAERQHDNGNIISTYHAGIPDVIKDKYNGRLVPEKTIKCSNSQ